MTIINAILLAIVEGLTEFIPVSSTGHLILVEQLLPVTDDPTSPFRFAYIVIIQLPAILAVVVYLWPVIWPGSHDETHRTNTMNLWFNIAVATVPAVVLGLMFSDVIERHLLHKVPVALALIVGGAILIAVERFHLPERYKEIYDFQFSTAVYIGMIQCLAMFPGTSRSAATIIGARALGASRPAAAEFSFLLAIPTMLGATLLTIVKSGLAFSPMEWLTLGIGSVVSFATAYLSVAFLMRWLRRHDFTAFGYYRIVLGVLVLAAYLTFDVILK